jgi:hypothetical protein
VTGCAASGLSIPILEIDIPASVLTISRSSLTVGLRNLLVASQSLILAQLMFARSGSLQILFWIEELKSVIRSDNFDLEVV